MYSTTLLLKEPSILFSIQLFIGIVFFHLSKYQSIQISIYLCIYLSIYLSIHLSIFPSIYLSIYLSIYQDPRDIEGIFDIISYNKGSSIIRMLENFLGEHVLRLVQITYIVKLQLIEVLKHRGPLRPNYPSNL